MLKTKIQEDLTQSLKNKEQDTVDTLRLLMSDIKNQEIETKTELSDEEVLVVLKKSVKKLKEALEMFEKGGRTDLAGQNKSQLEILGKYMPAEMNDEDLKKAIDDLISENQDLYDKNPKTIIGIVMNALSSQVDPQRIIAELNSRS